MCSKPSKKFGWFVFGVAHMVPFLGHLVNFMLGDAHPNLATRVGTCRPTALNNVEASMVGLFVVGKQCYVRAAKNKE